MNSIFDKILGIIVVALVATIIILCLYKGLWYALVLGVVAYIIKSLIESYFTKRRK